jgi:hypothetical protein
MERVLNTLINSGAKQILLYLHPDTLRIMDCEPEPIDLDNVTENQEQAYNTEMEAWRIFTEFRQLKQKFPSSDPTQIRDWKVEYQKKSPSHFHLREIR